MDSKEVEQSCGRVSSDQSLISLITANGEGSEKSKSQLLQLLLLDEAEERVVEGLQSHGEVRLNPEHVVIDPIPEAQEPTQALQDSEPMAPELLEATETLRRRLRAFGYGLPDLNSLIDMLRKVGKNPAKALRRIAKKLPLEVEERNCPRKTAQPEKPLTPVCGSEKLWRFEDEEQDAVEMYWADKFRDAKPHQTATETEEQEPGDKVRATEGGGTHEAAMVPQQEEEEDGLSYSSVDDDEFETERGEQRRAEVNMNSVILCPTHKLSDAPCVWYGAIRNLKNHVTSCHTNILRRGNVFNCNALDNIVRLILYRREIFLYYKYVSHTGIVYAVVQQVGVTNKKFKYSISLSAYDSVDSISFSFAVTDVSVPYEIIFDAGRCMAMTEDRLEPFVRNRQLEMVVRLREVRARSSAGDETSCTKL